MIKQTIFCICLILISGQAPAQSNGRSNYFGNDLNSIGVVMHIIDKYPDGIKTLLDEQAANALYDVMVQASDLENNIYKGDIFWNNSLEQIRAGDIELVEMQPIDAIFAMYIDSPQKYRQFKEKYKGEIYRTLSSRTFAIRSGSGDKSYVFVSQVEDANGGVYPYIRIFGDGLSTKAKVKVCFTIMAIEHSSIAYIVPNAPYFPKSKDLKQEEVKLRTNNTLYSQAPSFNASIIDSQIIKDVLIKNMLADHKELANWSMSIDSYKKPIQKKYFMEFRKESIPKWKRALIVASYLDFFEIEMLMPTFYSRVQDRFGVTQQEVKLATILIKRDFSGLDKGTIEALQALGITENIFRSIFEGVPTSVISMFYNDKTDVKPIYASIDAELKKEQPDLKELTDLWVQVISKSNNEQWADKFLSTIRADATKVSSKKAMIDALSCAKTIPTKLYSLMSEPWIQLTDIGSIFNNKKTLPWDFWDALIKTIKAERRAFMWWNLLSKLPEWPNSFREQVADLINYEDSKILLSLAERPEITKEEYMAVAELMKRTDLNNSELLAIKTFLTKREELTRSIWEALPTFASNYELTNTSEMFKMLSNKTQVPKELVGLLYNNVKFQSNAVTLDIIAEPLYLTLYNKKGPSSLFPLRREFNERGYALRLVKLSNQYLYNLRYKYKTMTTIDLLKEFQKRLDLLNFEYKYNLNWISSNKTYYSIVDLILSPDFNKVLLNLSNDFYDKIPKSESTRLGNSDQYYGIVEGLIEDNSASDYFMVTEISNRIRNKILDETASTSYDRLEIFSDYGLMVGFLGEDPTTTISDYTSAKNKLYELTINKIIDNGINEKDVRTFLSEGKLVSNLRDKSRELKKRVEFQERLRPLFPGRSPNVAYIHRDIQTFFEYAIAQISELNNKKEIAKKLNKLVDVIPITIEPLTIAQGTGPEQDAEAISTTIDFVNTIADRKGSNVKDALNILNERSNFANSRLSSMSGKTPSTEEVITLLQGYTGLETSDMQELREMMIHKMIYNGGKIDDKDDNELVFLFGQKEDGSGYYNYLSKNVRTDYDISELMVLSYLCYSLDNKDNLGISNLKFVATTYGDVSQRPGVDLDAMYKATLPTDETPMGIVTGSSIKGIIRQGYLKISEIKF